MRALGSDESPNARVRILSECRLGFLTRGNGFLAVEHLRGALRAFRASSSEVRGKYEYNNPTFSTLK
ncbi:hypothetical protein E2C01_036106 [Portunus trituberculatus]|uniref:Uncharacterized protein n=1 Tax=Portunus trituberculatus TaxID=210409 RepID=A0A5B7FDB0_PORTR|nr:hypothetical protein [Portunus trituberculatus]